MPTIRVDDDVFNGLKTIAEPFVDTPNTVIRRLLEGCGALEKETGDELLTAEQQVNVTAHTNVLADEGKEVLTSQSIYEVFLLYVLGNDFKGVGGKHEITKAVIAKMRSNGYIGPADLRRVSSGETKAENTIAWGRNALKEQGLISRQSQKGVWELTSKGMEKAKNVVLPKNY